MDLRQIDLNLLVSLDALLAECNVTRAARRLHLSQPALSAQLARLRTLFADPLLLPAETGRGMTPTARALALGPALHLALKDLESVVLHQPSFDPATDVRTFQLAMNDTAMVVIGLPLIEELAAQGITTGRAIRDELNRRKVPTFRNGSTWHLYSVQNVLKRLTTG